MRVLFLDIDGVLVLLGTGTNSIGEMEPAAVQELLRIILATGCSVVISSAWRTGEWVDGGLLPTGDIVTSLIAAGGAEVLAHVTDVTPSILGAIDWDNSTVPATVTRGDEIAAWLSEHEVESFVILDDLGMDRPATLHEDVGSLSDRLVLTNFEVGLTPERADEAIRLLQDPQAVANNEPAGLRPLAIVGKEQPTDDMIIIHFSNGRHETFVNDEGISDVRFGEKWMDFFLGDGSYQRWELDGQDFRRIK